MCEGAIHTFLTHVENCIFKLILEHICLQFDKVTALCAITKNIYLSLLVNQLT